jgi:uncharacterized protein (TIGR00661 family)
MASKKKINHEKRSVKVLIAPLDWGLGHATRCIPIIKELIFLDCDVIIAASGGSYFLLKNEFPSIVILRRKSPKISYTNSRFWMTFKMFLLLQKLTFYYIKNKKWIRNVVNQFGIDAVISDNQFGMFSREVTSVYITHQLHIKTGNKRTEKIVNKLHHQVINRYSYCWVPDFASHDLTGDLSQSQSKLQIPVSWLGPLSRFEKLPYRPKLFDALILLSGPEPQRTIFEKKILEQASDIKKRILLVRGLPDESEVLESNNSSMKIVNYLLANELNEVIHQSEIVICRSGYTSVMDLIKLGRKAILIPTPGQPEQEYLAQHLMKKKIFISINQEDFNLETSLCDAASFPFVFPEFQMTDYQNVIAQFVHLLKSNTFAVQ